MDVVLEYTRFYYSKDKTQAHIKAGAEEVVISAPASNDLPTIVYSVSKSILTADDKAIFATSCITSCLAPTAKALNDYAPIQSGTMSTTHACTDDQMILDGPYRRGDLRRTGASTANTIPNSTGATKAIDLIIPELSSELVDPARHVPILTGSIIILTAIVKKVDVTKEDINTAMEAVASESFGCSKGAVVSSGVVGMRYGSLLDITRTMVAQVVGDLCEV